MLEGLCFIASLNTLFRGLMGVSETYYLLATTSRI